MILMGNMTWRWALAPSNERRVFVLAQSAQDGDHPGGAAPQTVVLGRAMKLPRKTEDDLSKREEGVSSESG